MNATVPFQTQKPIFHKLESIADMANLTREERDYYHVSLDSYRTNLAVMEHERNEGRVEGRAEGMALVARNMNNSGIAIDVIFSCTGLSHDDISKL